MSVYVDVCVICEWCAPYVVCVWTFECVFWCEGSVCACVMCLCLCYILHKHDCFFSSIFWSPNTYDVMIPAEYVGIAVLVCVIVGGVLGGAICCHKVKRTPGPGHVTDQTPLKDSYRKKTSV